MWCSPRQADLQAIYDRLRAAIHTVKPDNIATFLGRKLNGNYQDEMGNRFNTRIEGTRIKHSMGPVSIKMYDKFRLILRIETTVVNVSFFKCGFRLLELCGVTDTLIGDNDGVYHPALFNDRLLLGLKGTMSEAELHIIRARLIVEELFPPSRRTSSFFQRTSNHRSRPSALISGTDVTPRALSDSRASTISSKGACRCPIGSPRWRASFSQRSVSS
jgi:hypothetical protein